MRKDNNCQSIKNDQLLSPFVSSVSLWNQFQNQQDFIHDTTTQMHTPQNTNLFSQKFKESISSTEFESNICPYHPQKKVKYVMIRDNGVTEKMCTKCAVSCAQQGCKIEEIQEDDVRKKQTDTFISQLVDTRFQVENIHQELLKTEQIIKDFYNEQYSQVVKTFSDVEKALQICKSQILGTLTQSMWGGIQAANQMKVQSKQIEHQISTYINDIKNNYDNIVYLKGTLPYNQIMGGYGSKLFKLQQCLKQLSNKKIPYLHFEGKETCLQTFINELSQLREKSQPESTPPSSIKKFKKESTRSSSEQKTHKSVEQEKRHQSQPTRQIDHLPQVKGFENSEKKNQTFKITEESIEEWMENSSSKQRENALRMSKTHNLQTEPNEAVHHHSPNLIASKFLKQSKPQRTSLKNDANKMLLDKLLEGFNQLKKEREQRPMKKMSKTPELLKSTASGGNQSSTKLAPKFLYKNYYK